MNKFQSRLSNVRKWFSVAIAVIIVTVLVAVHFVIEPIVEKQAIENPKVEIEIVYVTGNGVRVHKRPSEASDAIYAFNWCKSLIVFSRDREWVEIGEIEPIGWMHEGFLTNEKPNRCNEISR